MQLLSTCQTALSIYLHRLLDLCRYVECSGAVNPPSQIYMHWIAVAYGLSNADAYTHFFFFLFQFVSYVHIFMYLSMVNISFLYNNSVRRSLLYLAPCKRNGASDWCRREQTTRKNTEKGIRCFRLAISVSLSLSLFVPSLGKCSKAALPSAHPQIQSLWSQLMLWQRKLKENEENSEKERAVSKTRKKSNGKANSF